MCVEEIPRDKIPTGSLSGKSSSSVKLFLPRRFGLIGHFYLWDGFEMADGNIGSFLSGCHSITFTFQKRFHIGNGFFCLQLSPNFVTRLIKNNSQIYIFVEDNTANIIHIILLSPTIDRHIL